MAAEESEVSRYIWNEDLGVVDTKAHSLEIQDNKLLSRRGFWMVFVYRKKAPIRLGAIARLARQMIKVGRLCKVEVAVLEVRERCLFLKILVDDDLHAIDFSECVVGYYKKIIRPEHFVTAIRKPTDFEINEYIKGVRKG